LRGAGAARGIGNEGLEVGQKGRVRERQRLKGLERTRKRGWLQRAAFIGMRIAVWRGGVVAVVCVWGVRGVLGKAKLWAP